MRPGPVPMTSDPPPTNLPEGYSEWQWLTAARQGARVARASWRGRPVAVRIAPAGTNAERRAELAVLAAVDHPGLARLVDHGSLAGDGGDFVARTWIEGSDLAAWAEGREAEEAARVVARLAPALDHLHRRGFVHGDLKAANVIVREGPRGPEPILTDFGLARRSGAVEPGEGVSGTLIHLAPEVLFGGAVTPAADLFALGTLLHELLVGRRPGARAFYGRFPREDFFAATGTRPEELPDWARDLVAALVSRDPAQRPSSAARIGRTLGDRLGLAEVEGTSPTEHLRWGPLQGREPWLEDWCGAVSALTQGPGGDRARIWVQLPQGEDPGALLEALALRLSLRGSAVHRLDLACELGCLESSADLDRWASSLAEGRKGQAILAAIGPTDQWQARALAVLARVLGMREASQGGTTVLVALGEGSPPDPELGWIEQALTAPTPQDVEAFLRAQLAGAEEPGEHARLRHLAEVLCESGGRTATGIDKALATLARDGWLLVGEDRPRLRPGRLPERIAVESSLAPIAPGPAALLWAGLQVAGGRLALQELTGLTGGDTAAGLDQLIACGAARLGRDARTSAVLVEARAAAGGGWAESLEDADWRLLNERWTQRLQERGAPAWVALPHRVASGEAGALQLVDSARELREEGLAELALELVAAAEALSAARGEEPAPALVAELGFAWCALGQAERALAAIERLRSSEQAQVRALVARLEGQVATLRHEPALALERLEAASALDPQDGGEALLSRARVLFEARRYAELEGLLGDVPGAAQPGGLSTRVLNNLRALQALVLFRRGQVARARELLRDQAREACAQEHAAREASLEINLALLERRAGELDTALGHAGRAVELYAAAGNLAGLAQARALRGGALRDTGRPREAEPELAEALGVRERLGDRVGAASVRGMLGLTLAARGRARPALEELARAARELRTVGRSHDALLLEACAKEVSARLGLPADPSVAPAEVERAAEGDPRSLIALARAAWLQGQPAVAGELAGRARALGRSLGLGAVEDEAALLEDALAGRAGAQGDGELAASLAGQDQALCGQLARVPLDAAVLGALAGRLEELGRDDRAARTWLALAVRATDAELVARAATRAAALLEACATAASADERERLTETLLGFPDPWPEDLVAWRRRRSGTDEMEAEVIEILEINHRLLAQEDLRSLLGAIVEQALAVSGAQRGFLVLEEGGELSVDTALDSRRGGIDESDVELSGSALRQALEHMQPVRVSNAVDDPLLGAAPSVIALELRSILCVPFRADKTLRGVIYVDHRLREAAFDERAERMLRLLADQAALAVLQVRRLEEIRRLNRELSKHVVAVESDLKTARRELIEAGLPVTASGLVGSSEPMKAVRRLLERAAPSKLAVLVSGASGTGKELAARALHQLSPRAEGPFVSESCAALPPSLIEAELFGARKGAYTGADRDREGLFERAHGGTLFLDEIGELPLDLQAKLLRVLETSEVRRVGDERSRRVDFRLVAATNRDLEAEVARRPLPLRPLLPARGPRGGHAAAVGPRRRHPRAGRPLPAAAGARGRGPARGLQGRAGATRAPALAGQRARAGQRGRAPVRALGGRPRRPGAGRTRPPRAPPARCWTRGNRGPWRSSSARRSRARSRPAAATRTPPPRCSASRAPRSTSASRSGARPSERAGPSVPVHPDPPSPWNSYLLRPLAYGRERRERRWCLQPDSPAQEPRP